MRIVPLGINGFVPSFGRHTTSFLVLTSDEAVVLDAGTGLARLFEPDVRRLLDRYDELHIILSHYHLDHIVGLSYLPGIPLDMAVSIYAPAPPLVEAEPGRALGTLLRPPFFSLPMEEFPIPPRVFSVTEQQLTVGKSTVSVRAQTHPGGSIGVRIADLVFMTDTVVDAAAVPFMHEARLLLHEVWLSDEDVKENAQDLAGHSFASGVVNVALDARVRTVCPIHVHPRKTDAELQDLAEGMKRHSLNVIAPSEKRILNL